MEQPRADAHNFRKRLISAAVLIPVALGATVYGTPLFEGLVLAAFLILAHEWTGLCGYRGHRPAAGFFYAAGVAALAATVLAPGVWGVAAVLGGFAVLAAWHWLTLGKQPDGTGRTPWLAVGFLYIVFALMAFLRLRADPHAGLTLILMLFLIAWTADTGAYALGRLIGGPKLAPVISPNKTWAGFVGGTVCAGAVGAGFAIYTGRSPMLGFILAGAFLGIVSQGGDLLESGIKRHFHVKDTGDLIPGHGGLLDRIDSLLAMSWIAGIGYWSARDEVLRWM